MAKPSFWQKVKRWLGIPVKQPPKPPPKPPPTPPPPPPPPPTGPYDFNRQRYVIWLDITDPYPWADNARTTALEWWDLFLDTGAAFGDKTRSHINQLWRDFLRSWWLNSQEDDSLPRDDWYDEADVSKALIDWDHWRELKKTP